MNFKRKAHEVQAVRWTGENYAEVYAWVMSWDLSDPGIHRIDAENAIVVTANLVEATIEVGNWIVRDIDNEFFYPASEDEFAKGYEANMKAADAVIALGEQLTNERNIANDLWTWLPSHQVARTNHRDYADTVAPSVHDIMLEAAVYIHKLQKPDYKLEPDEKELFERCPCGEDHVGE